MKRTIGTAVLIFLLVLTVVALQRMNVQSAIGSTSNLKQTAAK